MIWYDIELWYWQRRDDVAGAAGIQFGVKKGQGRPLVRVRGLCSLQRFATDGLAAAAP